MMNLNKLSYKINIYYFKNNLPSMIVRIDKLFVKIDRLFYIYNLNRNNLEGIFLILRFSFNKLKKLRPHFSNFQ